ncbi:DcrB-related protein [Utexia brackfieldae]|uniref:DcrB-related protein n=1 Tax=Utexia brackfieldae TaxID=3074108 RepID=UPI00370D87BD
MNYQINEGKLTLIDDLIDESINIIKFPARQASLVISRAVLNQDQTEEAYFAWQMAALKRNMKRFLLGERKATILGVETENHKAIAAFETQLQFEQKGVVVHQLLLSAQLPSSMRLLVLTYAQGRPITELDKQFWQSIKTSFVAV